MVEIVGNWLTDRLPGTLRFYLTGNYRTRKEQEEFESEHDAGYSVMFEFSSVGDKVWAYVARSDGSPERWTAHGWCKKCDYIKVNLPPINKYIENLENNNA